MQCGRIQFTLAKIMNNLISTKNRSLFQWLVHQKLKKLQLNYNWLKIGTFQAKFDKIYFFYQHSQPLFDVMQIEIEKLAFVRGINFEYIDSLKNQRYIVPVIFWRLLWKDLQFKGLCCHCHRWETLGCEHNLH